MSALGRPTERELDDAKAILRRDYWGAVQDLAEQVRDAITSGEIADRSALSDYVWETVDSSYWVIYTHAQLQVLCWTDNDDAYFEEMGDELACDGSASTVYQTLAFFALRADVMDTLGDIEELFASDESEEES